MAEGAGVPDLDAYLDGVRTGGCMVCRIPVELLDKMDEKQAQGIHAWAAFAKWLEACGYKVTSSTLQYHYNARHHERP
jgi:hypothetical protein